MTLGVLTSQLAAVSDLEDVGFFSWNLAKGLLTLSDRASTMLRLPPGDEIGFRPADIRRLPVSRKHHHLRTARRAFSTGADRLLLTFVSRRANGDRRHMRASIRRIAGASGETITGAIIDQTDQRRIEAELRATLSTVPSAMIVINETGIIRAFSAAAETMFGRTSADMIGQPVETLMPEPDRSQHAGYLTRYLTSGDARIIGKSRVMSAVRADGSLFPIELWVGDASTESDRLFTGFIRDHSVRFEIEAKLQLLHSDLVHVARLSAVGELSLALAHELNQPLGALVNHLGIAEYLAKSGTAADQAPLQSAIKDAADEAMRAGTIVKRLRTFVEKGEADTRVEPVAAIIQEAVLLLSSAIRRKGITLTVAIDDEHMAALADRVQVQQVLFNLLRNAIEALEAPTSTPPRLRIAARALAADMIEISVEDNGPGIGLDRRDAIFVPFSSGKRGGMGVGLSISRRIIEAHGGELRYEPALGGGARFSFTLPAGAAENRLHD